MSGSRPDADSVTASGGTWLGLTPSRVAMICLRAAICACSTSLTWDSLEASENDGSLLPRPSLLLSTELASGAVAEGRLWKYRSFVGSFLALGSMGLTPIRLGATGCRVWLTM